MYVEPSKGQECLWQDWYIYIIDSSPASKQWLLFNILSIHLPLSSCGRFGKASSVKRRRTQTLKSWLFSVTFQILIFTVDNFNLFWALDFLQLTNLKGYWNLIKHVFFTECACWASWWQQVCMIIPKRLPGVLLYSDHCCAGYSHFCASCAHWETDCGPSYECVLWW